MSLKADPARPVSFDAIDKWLAPDETATITNCDREPIHIPGCIQPVGALLVIGESGTLCQASDNASHFLGIAPEEAAQQIFREISEGANAKIDLLSGGRSVRSLELGERRFSLIWHRIDGTYVCEIESDEHAVPVEDLIATSNRFSASLSRAASSAEAYQLAVEAVSDLIGYDRVMAYEFDREGHGHVLAEKLNDGVEGFLGLRFPGSDIPQQARRLYVLELTREIADTKYQPVPVSPTINPVTGRPLNMAYCHLRSVSPVHLEYLQNMGVSASFSVSVIVSGELVALIACHHLSTRRLDHRIRGACELIGRILSEFISRRKIEVARRSRNDQLTAQVDLLCELGTTRELSATDPAWPRAFDFVPADAFIVSVDGDRNAFGEKPDQFDLVCGVAERMANNKSLEISDLDGLASADPEIHGGGLLVVPVDTARWVAWYRSSQDRVVRWAGQPEQDASKDLTPRNSFELWKEQVTGRCTPWEIGDLEMADLLRRGLRARLSGMPERKDSFDQAMFQLREYVIFLEQQNHQLASSNVDLSQFANVTSHDLRGPLRTIRSFLPMIREELGEEVGVDATKWMGIVENAALTLHRLQEGLWSYSTLDREATVTRTDLNELVQNVLTSLESDLGGVDVKVSDLPTLEIVVPQIEALFRNLIQNAYKYREPERPLHIVVDSRPEGGGHVISVGDNGMGFPPSAKVRIFDLFSRLHPSAADGDGLGLALARRIVHHHRGWIRAESEPGNGAVFEFSIQSPPQTDQRP
ncbi:MAG: ATP-binding protein [Myxococcota bacterium]